jgi:hypothetical protein
MVVGYIILFQLEVKSRVWDWLLGKLIVWHVSKPGNAQTVARLILVKSVKNCKPLRFYVFSLKPILVSR